MSLPTMPPSPGFLSRLRRRGRPRRLLRSVLEPLEGRVVPATVLDGGTSTLTIHLDANDHLSLEANASSYTISITAPSGVDSENGPTSGKLVNKGIQSGNFDNPPPQNLSTTSLTVNSNGVSDYQSILIDDSLGTGSAVNLLDSNGNVYAANIGIDLENSPGPQSVQVQSTAFSGNAGLTVKTTDQIQVLSGSQTYSIATGTGAVSLTAGIGGGANFASGDYIGVEVEAPIETNSGPVTVVGNGSTAADPSNDSSEGVRIINNGLILTYFGSISVSGTAGSANYSAVALTNTVGAYTGIISTFGNISITGDGGTTTSGVYVGDGSFVKSLGTGANAGTVSIHGTSTNYFGVDVNDAAVSTSAGNASITGTTASTNGGIGGVAVINDGAVTSSGNGSITIAGHADDPNSTVDGITVYNGASITATGAGGVSLTGTSVGHYGIVITDGGTTVSAADGPLSLDGTSSATGGGLGGVAVINGGAIGTTGSGSITVHGTGTGAGSIANGTLVYGAGAITTTGTGGIAITGSSVGQDGVNLSDSNSKVTTAGGNISISGTTAATDGSPAVAIQSDALLGSTGAGNISIGGTATGSAQGIGLYNSSSVQSAGGVISIIGQGSGNGGIEVSQGVTLGTTGGSGITLQGTDTASSGDNSDGIRFGGTGPSITTVDGDIALIGQAGGDDALQLDPGSTATLSASGAGSITLSGTSTASGSYGEGIEAGSLAITTKTGNISISGTTSSEHGISLSNSTIQATAAGAISFDGTSTTTATYGDGVQLDTVTVGSAGGGISFTGHSAFNSGITLQNSGVSTTGSATITLDGTSTTTASAGQGIELDTASIASVDGKIALTGSSTDNDGIALYSSSTIQATGAGAVDLNGTSTATDYSYGNYGVAVSQSQVKAAGGALTVEGSSSLTSNPIGILIQDGSTVGSSAPG